MYQSCCEKYGQSRISQFSHAPSQFFWPAMCLAGARGPAAVFLLTWKAGFLRWARTAPCAPGAAAQVPPPGKEQGKATWAADTMLSLKASLVPAGGRTKDSNSFSLPATGLPVCEVVCVCVRVCLHGKGPQHRGGSATLTSCSLWVVKASLSRKQNQADKKGIVWMEIYFKQLSAAFPAPSLPVGFRQ